MAGIFLYSELAGKLFVGIIFKDLQQSVFLSHFQIPEYF
ncbi:hypothetical protein LEP1GSC033_2787 [Leptospira interrogans str. 2002000632]|nr:hypothetical protein LEP1GSC033_2787 [Leptospira interrogans str. 2002000632]